MYRLRAFAAALIVAGIFTQNVDVALLSVLPAAALVLNSLLPPPRVEVRRRRTGSLVELIVESSRLPGVFYIYELPSLEAKSVQPKWRIFKPPLKRRLVVAYHSDAAEQDTVVVVEAYNPALTASRVAVYQEARSPPAPPSLPTAGVDEFVEIRRYQPGDPARRIHWKASAKTGVLYVNKFQGLETKTAVVVVDARRLKRHVVAAAAKLGKALSERGYAVVYYTPGGAPSAELPRDPPPVCGETTLCGDVTIYVGSLYDVCKVKCRKVYYLDVGGANPLAALRRLGLYRQLREGGAVVKTDIEELLKAL